MPRAVFAASNANHRVPQQPRAETERTLAATPGIRGEPSDAERSRTLLGGGADRGAGHPRRRWLPVRFAGQPRRGPAGRPLLLLSDLAEHSRNLAADPRASLMASEQGSGDPLALARVTVIGRVAEVPRGRARSGAGGLPGRAARRVLRRVRRLPAVPAAGRLGALRRRVRPDELGDADEYTAAEPDPLRPHAAGSSST